MSALTTPTSNHSSRYVEKHLRVAGVVTARNVFTENEWVPYVPTVGAGANTLTAAYRSFKYRLNGRTLTVSAQVARTGGAVGTSAAGTYTFTLPTGCIVATGTTYGHGPFYLNDRTNTLLYVGNVYVTGGASPTFSAIISSELVAPVIWAHGTAGRQLDAAAGLDFGTVFSVELDPTSPILLGMNV